MVVTVRLHSILRRETPQGVVDRLELELEPEATVASVLARLGLQAQARLLLVVNGELAHADQPLADGDEVRLIPAVSGG